MKKCVCVVSVKLSQTLTTEFFFSFLFSFQFSLGNFTFDSDKPTLEVWGFFIFTRDTIIISSNLVQKANTH